MSDFIEMFCEMLPVNSEIQKENNEFRKVLDKSLGTYMDEHDDIFDELFLTSATGGWLDAHGKDYGVVRKIDEDDESYRQRIIFEKLEYLTAHNLQNIYNLTLYVYIASYNPTTNKLTSDNAYLDNKYMTYADSELKKILNSKFVIGGELEWL
jgi:hypothetical protein